MMTPSTSLPPSPDVCRVTSSVVSCDGRGNGEALGHPLVYLNMGEEGCLVCPYCSRQFVLIEQSDYKGS